MFRKKFLLICIFSLLLLFQVPHAFAAPPVNDLNQYLKEIGWTNQELMDYLDYYEIPLNEFNSVADLKDVLGTPINDNNYQNILAKYNLSDKELNDLMIQFGDSLSNYKFIEDLDNAVAFYTNHDEYMAKIKSELAQMGITDQESKNFFQYLAQVEEENKNQLDQMQSLDYQIENFLETTDPTQLTHQEVDELAQIFNQSMDLYGIKVKFKMNNKALTLNDLLKMRQPPGNLYTQIYSNAGDLLVDFTIPSEVFQGIIAGWEEILHIGELANELVDYLHNEKYNDVKMNK